MSKEYDTGHLLNVVTFDEQGSGIKNHLCNETVFSRNDIPMLKDIIVLLESKKE